MTSLETLRDAPWHIQSPEQVLSELETDKEEGLTDDEARDRLDRYGKNRIRSQQITPWYRILLHQFTDPLIYILLLAAAISLLFQEYVDAVVILAVVLLNATIGFVQEYRARKAIQSLTEISAPKARVIRHGEEREIASEEVVPGDLVVLDSGAKVPGDLRLLEARDLQTDESALTGESEPVSKQADPVDDEKAVPGDQFSMAFSGTSVTRGRGRGVVVRTGDVSELGQIAEATQNVDELQTPIQAKMDSLGKLIGVAVLVLSLIVVVSGLLLGWETNEIVRTVVALAVGTVPEALPVVLTVTLAIGVRRMAKRNAIIRQLPAVETLGSTTIIGSDKTGTLTTNQMTVQAIWAGGDHFDVSGSGYSPEGEITGPDEEHLDESSLPQAVRKTLLTGLLANESRAIPDNDDDDADADDNDGGDPTEIALLVSARKAGFDLEQVRQEHEEIDVVPFESDLQFMATLNDTPEGRCIFLKGSPEALLERCTHQLTADGEEEAFDQEEARDVADHLAEQGYRVLAMAFKPSETSQLEDHEAFDELVFAGFQAMEDPVRPEALDAVKDAQQAGIRVLMLTGDHVRTARAIGEQLGIGDGEGAEEGRDLEDRSDEELDEILQEIDIYARVSPDHKLKIVERLQARKEIVAVTGDGVNDAPALQAAHLGVAMGKAGTDVAREAADMVLADDNFASITSAVEEGRVVFSNIRKVTYFLLSTGVGLVLAILSAVFGPWPLPFVAAQVLWINLVTKGLQDVALAFEPGEPGLLQEPPRNPEEGVINRSVLYRMVGFGFFMALGTLAAFWWILAQDVSLEFARSVAMTQLVMFQFFHVFNCRSFHRSIFQVSFLSNPYVMGAVLISLLAHLSILHLPFMQMIFETEPLPLQTWAIITAIALSILVVAELDKWLLRRSQRSERLEQEPGDATLPSQ